MARAGEATAMLRRFTTLVALTTLSATAVAVAGSGTAQANRPLPVSIALPHGFQPEGLTVGRGTSFYVGAPADGAGYPGGPGPGRGRILVPGTAGPMKTGPEGDGRH